MGKLQFFYNMAFIKAHTSNSLGQFSIAIALMNAQFV